MSAWFSAAAYRASIDSHLRLLGKPPATDAEFELLVARCVDAGQFRPYMRDGSPGYLVQDESVTAGPLGEGH